MVEKGARVGWLRRLGEAARVMAGGWGWLRCGGGSVNVEGLVRFDDGCRGNTQRKN